MPSGLGGDFMPILVSNIAKSNRTSRRRGENVAASVHMKRGSRIVLFEKVR